MILSKAALTYAEAQMRIDSQDSNAVTDSLRNLNRLAKILKLRRIDAGALSLASTEVRFHLDSETHDPVSHEAQMYLFAALNLPHMMIPQTCSYYCAGLLKFSDTQGNALSTEQTCMTMQLNHKLLTVDRLK